MSETVNSSEQVKVNNQKAKDLIDKLQTPASPEEVRAIQKMIGLEAEQLQTATEESAFAAVNRAEENVQQISERLDTHKRRFPGTGGGSLKDKDHGSLALLVAVLLSLGIVLVAEYEISETTIPYVLNLRKSDWGAILLCLSIVGAVTTTLKIGLGKLFWEPYQKLRESDSAVKRAALKITMAVYLMVMSGLSVYTIAKVSEARSEALKLKESIRTEKIISVDPEKIDKAIWFLAISLVLSGGLFFLVAETEGKKLWAYRKALSEAEEFRAEQAQLAQALSDAKVELADKQRASENAVSEAKRHADHYRERHQHALTLALKRPPVLRPYRDIVEETLAHQP